MKDIQLLFLVLIYRIELNEYCIIMYSFQYGHYYSLLLNLASILCLILCCYIYMYFKSWKAL